MITNGTTNTKHELEWPGFIQYLEPELSKNNVPAEFPLEIATDVLSQIPNKEHGNWNGKWSGSGSHGRSVDVKVIMQQRSDGSATAVTSFYSATAGQMTDTVEAKFVDNELIGSLSNGSTIRYRMRHPDAMEFIWRASESQWMAGVLTRIDVNSSFSTTRIPVISKNRETDLTLEAFVFKPTGPGPFPTVIFNHGACGSGTDPDAFRHSWTSPPLARFLTERGYMVIFPQRRGRSNSGGQYLEGLASDGTGYSIKADEALAGFNHALEDVHSAVEWAYSNPEIDQENLLLCGQSRGSLLSLVYANENPGKLKGVINFVGGWIGDSAPSAEIVNENTFKRTAGMTTPSLWVYAESDSYYNIDDRHAQYEKFIASDGNGTFHSVKPLNGSDGHCVVFVPSLWDDIVDTYLHSLG